MYVWLAGFLDAVRICDPDPTVAEVALRDERISGVTFTGSHPTAKRIQRVLADRDGPIIPLLLKQVVSMR